MKLQIKYDVHKACRIILQDYLEKHKIPYVVGSLGEIEIENPLTPQQQHALDTSLKRYGIQIIDNPRNVLVQQIKDIITELIYNDEVQHDSTLSAYIADKLNLSYSYLSKIFSEEMHTSIENYMIIQRVNRVKQMIMENKHTLTEMAWRLNYSSVAHLSNQFKKITGLTPTMFQRIIERRNNMDASALQKHIKRVRTNQIN